MKWALGCAIVNAGLPGFGTFAAGCIGEDGAMVKIQMIVGTL